MCTNIHALVNTVVLTQARVPRVSVATENDGSRGREFAINSSHCTYGSNV